MPWIKRQAKEHSCKMPNINSQWRVPPQAGDIWQCSKCEAKWEVRQNDKPLSYLRLFRWVYVE